MQGRHRSTPTRQGGGGAIVRGRRGPVLSARFVAICIAGWQRPMCVTYSPHSSQTLAVPACARAGAEGTLCSTPR